MASLIDISNDLLKLADRLDDPNLKEEQLLELFEQYMEKESEEQDKIENICNFTRSLYYRSQQRLAEIKRIKKLVDQDNRLINQLEQLLIMYLQNKGLGLDDFYQTKTNRIKICKSGGRIPIVIDPTLEKNFDQYKSSIPPEYKETVEQLNKRKIREDLENGIVLEFARISEQSIYLRGVKPEKIHEES